MIKNILALDTATVTGVAILKDRMVGFKTIDLKKFNKKRGQLHSEFLVRIDSLILELAPDIIYKEQGFFASGRGRAAQCLYGFHTLVELSAFDCGIPVVDVHNTTLKKFMAGSGRASKEDMIAAVRAKHYLVNNDHEADAVALLLYAAKEQGIDLD